MDKEKSIDEFLLDKDEIAKRAEDFIKRINECKERGHPELIDVFSYHPPNITVLQKCTYCNTYKERPVNQEEINRYYNLLKQRVTF